MENKETTRFFLIDDDVDDQEIFAMALESVGESVKCVCADNGADGLRMLEDNDYIPDFIFVDMNMPRMNGKQCLQEIKKMEKLKGVPVFMYSTSADPNTISETHELGASGFIVKPTSLTALTETIVNLLKHRRKKE